MFFLNDPSMVVASLTTLDLDSSESEFFGLESRFLTTDDDEERRTLFSEGMRAIYGLARRVDRWLLALSLHSENQTARILGEALAAEIEEQLAASLQKLELFSREVGPPLREPAAISDWRSFAESLDSPTDLPKHESDRSLDWQVFGPTWKSDASLTKDSLEQEAESAEDSNEWPFLNPIFTRFVDAILEWRSSIQNELKTTLEEDNHRPQVALYLAFTKLFQHAQNSINTFSERYIDFYYRDVLRENPRKAKADSLYLTFQPEEDEEVDRETIPLGTLFAAGDDAADNEILYASDADLTVTSAKLSKLRAVRVHCDPVKSLANENGQQRDRATPPVGDANVLATKFDIAKRASTEMPAPVSQAWPTFGATEPGTTEFTETQPATIGFAIASIYFWLTGGTRDVDIRFTLPPKIGKQLARRVRRLAAETGLKNGQVLTELFRQHFGLYASTEDGWFEVPQPKIMASRDPVKDWDRQEEPSDGSSTTDWNVLSLQFTLDSLAPPWVAFASNSETDSESDEASEETDSAILVDDERVNATNPDPTLPTLKAYVQSTNDRDIVLKGPLGSARVANSDFLFPIQFESYRIHTRVRGLSDLELQNPDGPIDGDEPFPIFGGLPTVGSALLLRQPELFSKQLTSLRLRVDWFDLPPNETGFTGYYRDYLIGLDGRRHPRGQLLNNQSFLVNISVQSPGRWTVQNASIPCPQLDDPISEANRPAPQEKYDYLFRTKDKAGQCRMPENDRPLCSWTRFSDLKVCPATVPDFYQPTDSALTLELVAPNYAFGNDLYPQNVLSAVIKDLPDVDACNSSCSTECQILADTAFNVETFLFDCIDKDGTKFRDCMTARLQAPIRQLRISSLSCFVCCLSRCLSADKRDLLGSFRDFESTLTSEEILEDEVAGHLDKIQAHFRNALDDEDIPCLEDCWKTAKITWDAANQIYECVQNLAEKETKDEMVGEVRKCKAQLDAAHETCLKDCVDQCMTPKNELKYPNEPYLPQAENISVEYQAACRVPTHNSSAGTLKGSAKQKVGVENSRPCASFFHLLPFDGYQRVDVQPDSPTLLLPRYPHRGNLYFGFEGLQAPQTITLLFQMTARAPKSRLQIQWWYLSNNQWHRQVLPPESRKPNSQSDNGLEVLADSTNGLKNSGIVTLKIPSFEASKNTILSPEYRWLRVTATRQVAEYPKTSTVIPHVVTATNVKGRKNRPDRPLPPGSITGSVEDLPYIASINQPTASFGGRPRENVRRFQTRLGERLRHKDRGVLNWDYERLVLEKFPTIWKVQTLPVSDGSVTTRRVGEVTLVVVPGPHNTNVLDPTAPLLSRNQLDEITEYLSGLISPFIKLRVINPSYLRITVDATLTFRTSEKLETYVNRLDTELVEYLSPWFFDAARAAKRGRYASRSDISEFIQSRPYVSELHSLERKVPSPPGEYCFLTSAPHHQIKTADARQTPTIFS